MAQKVVNEIAIDLGASCVPARAHFRFAVTRGHVAALGIASVSVLGLLTAGCDGNPLGHKSSHYSEKACNAARDAARILDDGPTEADTQSLDVASFWIFDASIDGGSDDPQDGIAASRAQLDVISVQNDLETGIGSTDSLGSSVTQESFDADVATAQGSVGIVLSRC